MASAGGPDDHWAAEIRRFSTMPSTRGLIDDTVYYRLVIELQHRTEERAAAVRSEPGSVRAGREELLWPELTVPPRASVSSQELPPPPKASCRSCRTGGRSRNRRRSGVRSGPSGSEPCARCWRPSSPSTASLTSAWCSRSSERSGSWSSPTASSTAPATGGRGGRPARLLRHRVVPATAAGATRRSRAGVPWRPPSSARRVRLARGRRRARRTSSGAAGRGARAGISWRCAALRRMVGEAPASPVPRCADGLAGRLGARARVRR